MKAKLQLKCGKIMKFGVVRLIYNAWQRKGVWIAGSKNAVAVVNCGSTMRGSAKAFGSRALKRLSLWLQFIASRKHVVLQLPKKSAGEIRVRHSSSR